MEAIKLLMFLCSIDLHEENTTGKDVPVFVWLLFARDTSETPSQFLRHHLNPVGDSSGVEQVRVHVGNVEDNSQKFYNEIVENL